MSLLATLVDLAKGCPRNIKRRLLRDILIILFVTSGAILAIVLIQGIKTQRDISTAIIAKANIQVSTHFQSFADPLSNVLKILGKWGEAGLLKISDDNKLIATQFQALMEIQPTIHSISIADTEENNIQLSHLNNEWFLHDFNKTESTSAKWINETFEDIEILTESYYSMATANWFRGAMLNPSTAPFFMTEPYLQPSTGEVVITVSLRWNKRNTEDSNHVSAVSFTVQSLMLFIEELQVTPDSRILLFEKSGTILTDISNNSHNSNLMNTIQANKSSDKLLAKVAAKIKANNTYSSQVFSIKNDGKTWWLGLNQLHESNNDVWVAVLIPEDDIFSDLYQQWLRFGLIVGSILLFGIFMTVFLVRKYSHQLKDLPQQQIQSEGYETEVAALIQAGESTTLEFKSTMRTNLKTGKTGKEIEIAWLKTVAAFMNSDGGILLIGVADSGEILGTEADDFANEDKCRLHFKNMLNTHIGAEFTRFIHLKIVQLKNNSILIVECERVRRPVFLSMGKQEEFFIRSGPSSIKLSMSQMVKYLGER